MLDFIRTRPFAAINIAGIFLVIITFLVEPFAAIGFFCALLIELTITLKVFLLIIIIILAAVNIAAYFAVMNFKTARVITLTVLGGGIGAMLGIQDTEGKFSAGKAVKIIFLVDMWIAVWLILGFLLYWFNYYNFSIGF